MSNAHPMHGFVWIGKLPRDDVRRNTTMADMDRFGTQVQDAHERGHWRDIADTFFVSPEYAHLTFNDLRSTEIGRYGFRCAE